jgi:hypothetical protein
MVRHYENQLFLAPPSQSADGSPANFEADSSGGALGGGGHFPASSSTSSGLSSSDPMTFVISLSHISALIRKAMRSLQGEDDDVSPPGGASPTPHQQPGVNGYDVDEDSERDHDENDSGGGGGGGGGSSDHRDHRRGSGLVGAAASFDPAAVLGLDPSEGGYLSLVTSRGETGNRSLEADIELERLRRENDDLRTMLLISEEAWRNNANANAPSEPAM